ncbi:MAG: HAD-IA family hydrolase, partial [Pseudomonadota bacterium]
VAEEELDWLNRSWHRLLPWQDTVPGLTRLRTLCPIAPVSNGNLALMTHLARYAALPWDVILGAEVAQAYKPMPEAYIRSAAALTLAPSQCMMVAAHNNDLHAAREAGLLTAFVPRPLEHGPGQTLDLVPDAEWDLIAHDFIDLAEQLGA